MLTNRIPHRSYTHSPLIFSLGRFVPWQLAGGDLHTLLLSSSSPRNMKFFACHVGIHQNFRPFTSLLFKGNLAIKTSHGRRGQFAANGTSFGNSHLGNWLGKYYVCGEFTTNFSDSEMNKFYCLLHADCILCPNCQTHHSH